MLMSNKQIVEETKAIVEEHAPLILKQLGLENNDGILDRITTTATIGDGIPNSYCEAKVRRVQKLFITISQEYVEGTATITMNPLMLLHYANKKGDLKQVPFFVRLFKKQIRRLIIFCLAHELRHYWQYYTGEYFKNEIQFNGASLMPYDMRWCEVDANKFATGYVKSLKNKNAK